MIKKLLIVVVCSIVMHMSAMEFYCSLAHMPDDVQSLIAYFLTCDDETEVDFIKRARTGTKVPNELYCQYYQKLMVDNQAQILAAFCPDKTKVALIEKISTGSPMHILGLDYKLTELAQLTDVFLQIIDLPQEEKEGKVLYKGKLALENYQCIALSSRVQTIATVAVGVNSSVLEGNFYHHFLTVQNLDTQQIREFGILPFRSLSIAFNKQGTHIIAYNASTWKDGVKQDNEYKIFPLKVIEKSSAGVVDKKEEKDLLQNYFRERRICKSIEKSK